VHGGPRVNSVELTTGERINADLIVVGIGANPRVELAAQFGLDIHDGILVDEYALASDGRTVAAGDCANMPNPLIHGVGSTRLRLESVNNATEQAKVAAATLAGDMTPYRSIPWFWSDQFDIKLQVAGVIGDHDDVVIRGNIDSSGFTVFYYSHGSLIAAECVNNPVEFMAVRGAMLRGNTIPPDAAADPNANLKRSAVPTHASALLSA
jgi:3-phenylpropionate/trans-cinnamate dioxygenase ferredoxin reductase subunit